MLSLSLSLPPFPSSPAAQCSAVCPLALSVASLAVYVRGEGSLALRLCVRSGHVYICLALEPGTWSIVDVSQKRAAGPGDPHSAPPMNGPQSERGATRVPLHN